MSGLGFVRRSSLTLGALVIVLAMWACGGEVNTPATPVVVTKIVEVVATPATTPIVRVVEVTATPRPTFNIGGSPSAKSLAIDSIMGYSGVVDAAITKRGSDISMVLIVSWATNAQYARQLGDNFVRLYKTFSPDDAPGATIGQGIYNYLIGVYYPNEKQVAQGAKAKYATGINW